VVEPPVLMNHFSKGSLPKMREIARLSRRGARPSAVAAPRWGASGSQISV